MNDLTGQHLGARFEVTARADDLGLGPAWTARDAELGDLCVVRALRPDRDLRPLEPYRRLQGTRVLSLRAVGVEHDSAWAASDAPEGQPLARLLDAARREGRPIELAEARALGLALSSALFTAHQLGDDRIAAHGALTPWCVHVRELSARDCDLAVGDFGLLPHLLLPSATHEAARLWLPVAPELAGSERRPTPAADVFAAAMILAETLSLTPARATLFAAITGDPRTLGAAIERLRPGLHASVRDALVAALQRDPGRRPPNANRFARLLRDATWTEALPHASARPEPRDIPPPPPPEPQPAARPRVSEVWVAPAASRPRAVTAPEEDTVRSVEVAPAARALLAEPDTEIVTGQRFDADPEETLPLSRPPTTPIAPSPPSPAHEVTVGLDVQYTKFGKGGTLPALAQSDSGTVVVAPAAAAAYLHVAEQQRAQPTPDFEATAAVDAATIARASATPAAAERRRPPQQPAAPAGSAAPTAPWWVPAAILGAAVGIGALVFLALTRG